MNEVLIPNMAADYEVAPIDLSRLNARLAEARMPPGVWATVAGLTEQQAEAIREGKTPPTRQQVARIAAAINVSPAYLMGQTTPEVPKPPTASPVVNPADVARVHAASKAQAARRGEPDPVTADLLAALEIEASPDPAGFDYEGTAGPISDGTIDLPSRLYRFGVGHRVPLSVLVAIDRIAAMLAPRFEPRSPAQWAAFYKSCVPLAKAVVRLSAETGTDFFVTEEPRNADSADIALPQP
jgi:hypothetical protein